MHNLYLLLIVLLISISEAGAQSLSFLSYKSSSSLYFYLSWLLYLVIVALLYIAYRFRGVGYINVIWSGMTTALMLFIGWYFFDERLSVIEWFGVCLILLGIVLMTFQKL